MSINYKSTRLLVDAVNRELDEVRKAAMGNMALGSLNDLRDLVAQLIKKAERVAVEDVSDLAPVDYVMTMKPAVAEYHRLLLNYNQIAPCLCMDLRAAAVILVIVGDGSSTVKTAHDPNRPDAAFIVEAMVGALDDGMKAMAEQVSKASEAIAGVTEEATLPTTDNVGLAARRVLDIPEEEEEDEQSS